MLFDDKLSDIIRTLESDGVLLHATDYEWVLACSSQSATAIERIKSMTNTIAKKPITLMADSIDMLKKHVPLIHPRIETLLHYHHHPLTVIYPDVKKVHKTALSPDGSAAMLIATDLYCQRIISLLGAPLFSTTASTEKKPRPRKFTMIDREIINQSDFISIHRKHEILSGKPPVMISYDEEGEIIFLRP